MIRQTNINNCIALAQSEINIDLTKLKTRMITSKTIKNARKFFARCIALALIREENEEYKQYNCLSLIAAQEMTLPQKRFKQIIQIIREKKGEREKNRFKFD